MANLVSVLKEEVRRLARKEIRAQVGTTKQAVAQFRREIASLKREIRQQTKKISFLQSQARKQLSKTKATPEGLEGVRFSARSVKAQRNRLGLSAKDYGRLVGVSGLTVYNWEHGKSRPRQSQLAALASVRGIGKREASARLDLLNGQR